MRPKILFPSILISIIACLLAARAYGEEDERRFTTTLLPFDENRQKEGEAKGFLWVKNKPAKEIHLRFDLNSLPAGLTERDFDACTLRLVAGNRLFGQNANPTVQIQGCLADDDAGSSDPAHRRAIIQLRALSDRNEKVALNTKTSDAFREAVFKEYSGDKTLSLTLWTKTADASCLLYSTEEYGDSPSNIPRLVITYRPGPAGLLESLSWTQHQHNPEHTGRSPWIPFQNPTGFTVHRIPANGMEGTIADYPLIYQGNFYLINKRKQRNFLVTLDFKGNELRRVDIGQGTVQRSPVISRDGIMYAVTENAITAYKLNGFGSVATLTISGKLSSGTDLTIGNGGALFLVLTEDGLDHMLGFTLALHSSPTLRRFFKSAPFASVSDVTVSPDGRKVFAQTPRGGVVVEIADPSQQQLIQLRADGATPFDFYHTPVAGPSGGRVFVDFTRNANSANVWGIKGTRVKWNSRGTLVSQPVLSSDDRIYFIQDGRLNRRRYDDDTVDTFGDNLNATSNLVMDGANNVYFWDNGVLHGYTSEGQPLFVEKQDFTNDADRPEECVRLLLAPDGTLWANNKNGRALHAFIPRFADNHLRLEQDHIRNQTAYRATGSLVVNALKLKKGISVLFQAKSGITFATGFTVQEGASLLCRVGF